MVERAIAPVDAAARERAVHCAGSVLVQAPAGSGKTTLLVQRYLHLLARVDAPERILALTFTRRAAEEMRSRVSAALQGAHSATCPTALEPKTWELAVIAARQLQTLGVDPHRHAARLRIETIDAFNAWLAGNLPIGAGTGAPLRMAEDPSPLYAEAARRALAYAEPDAFGAAVDRVLALGDQRWSLLLRLITEMLPSRERWLPLLAGGLQAAQMQGEAQLADIRRRFDDDLALLVSRALGDAFVAIGVERIATLSALVHAAARRAGGSHAEFGAWRGEAAPLRTDPQDTQRWRGLTAIALNKDGTVRSRLTKNEGFPSGCTDKPVMQDLLAQLAREPRSVHALRRVAALPEARYGDADWSRVRDVAQALLLAAAELDQVFSEQGSADFPAVSIAARRALGSPEAPTDLALRLDYRLQHILIDEFQDTSGAQLDLLRLLTAGWQPGDGRSVFCVGDPMQSIYGFRQAEVRAFLELAEDGIGDLRFDVQRLSSNFRAAQPLVDWSNGVFAQILPARDDRDRGAIAFRPSRPVDTGGDAAQAEVRLTGYATRDEEACAIAASIAARTALHPDWRIAVLVRARAHAREIAVRLRERGIAFHAVDIEPLADRPSVRDLIMLARALLHLGDRTAWLAVLRAPWSGLVLSDLWRLARTAAIVWDAVRDDAVLATLSADGAARCRRLRTVLEQAFALRNRSGFTRWLERIWLALGGPGCAADAADLDDVGAAFTRFRDFEQRGMPDPADLAGGFDDLYARDEMPSRVEIMTIHKAKGLEFDVVIVPALDRAIPQHRDEFLLSLQFSRAGRDGMVMAARPAVGADTDRLFEFLRRQARDAGALEAERLLYVACTRAKRQLHLSAVQGAPAQAADAWTPRAGSLLDVLWPVAGARFAPPPADAPLGAAAPPAAPVTGLGAGPLARVAADWRPAPLETPFALSDDPLARAARIDAPVFDWAGETARQVGSLVHAELQLLDPQRSGAAAIRARAAYFRRWLALRGVPDTRLRAATERAVAALIAVQSDPRGRWILRHGRRDDLREQALSGLLNGAVVRVVFDRSFIDERGIRWVIDYKTSAHMGGGADEFLNREVERYRPQLQRYATLARRLGPEPVRIGLYFPLLRAWREWEP